ncbi:hypothetical protein [Pedobacter jamesrossensis]|uniref:Uncharacterized protein n=1 Tax=Pedobacter jamesrossensis TaxID=1908238 RepID=A0ABV8NIW7_9SPHI
MEFSVALYSVLLESAITARSYRQSFDVFWKSEQTQRMNAHHAYFIRHVSMLNAFDNFLFLFCSESIWTGGGKGAWTNLKGVDGPLQPLCNGDQIDKIISLLTAHKDFIMQLFTIHEKPLERAHLEYEVAHIKHVLNLYLDSFNDIRV